MRYFYTFLLSIIILGCQKDKDDKNTVNQKSKDTALAFSTAHYNKQSKLPCKDTCTYADIEVPLAQNTPVVADSINNKIFNTVRSIVYFGEKPSNAKTYKGVVDSFVSSYEEMVRDFPDEGLVSWEAKIKGTIQYRSKDLLNIKINNYMFTGGAHGYEGDRSLIFDLKTGKSLAPEQLFTDVKSFTALAENKFREKHKIPLNKGINSTGLMFEGEKFRLPQNIFFTDKGILLHYNAYEAASYADGAKDLLIPYNVANDYLKIK